METNTPAICASPRSHRLPAQARGRRAWAGAGAARLALDLRSHGPKALLDEGETPTMTTARHLAR
jgi:hypothetical protein